MPRRVLKTPRKSGGPSPRSAKRTPGSGSDRLNGYFKDGEWTCNCEPRQIAVCLQVKKPNRNRGRWFYTCPNERRKQCEFFLWKEDAEAREKGVVLHDTQAEAIYGIGTSVAPLSPTPASTSARSDHREDSVKRRLFQTQVPVGERAVTSQLGKRKHAEFTNNYEGGSFTERGEFDDESELDSEDEQQLLRLVDGSPVPSRRQADESLPREAFTTPGLARSYDVLAGALTPISHRKPGATAISPRIKRERLDDGAPPPESLVPAATRQASVESTQTLPRSSHEQPPPYDVIEEILLMLPAGAVSDTVRDQIKQRLALLGLRTKSIERGRELAREEVRKKTAEMQGLQTRVAELESESKKDKDTIARLRAAVAALAGGD